MSEKHEEKYWLDHKRNVDKVLWTLIGLCGGLFAVDLFLKRKTLFDIEHWIGFYPIYGFVGAFLLVLAAKQMRKVLQRDEDYYDR